MKNILGFIKKEAVLTVSFLLAVVSAFIVSPDGKYLEYFDFHTLTVLLCLMTVTAGLRALGVFSKVGNLLLKKTRDVRSLAIVSVMLCFVFSMFVTNDVALITFVPFAIEVFIMAGAQKHLIPVIVLQTIAANLGSMLTPIGNPQNLYLYSLSGMSLADFVLLMLPYTLLSLAGILAACFILFPKAQVDFMTQSNIVFSAAQKSKIIIYVILFFLAAASVARLVHYLIAGAIVLAAVIIFDRKVLLKPDYSLIFTFVFLFVFIGNLKRVTEINLWLQSIIEGNELITSVLSSQVISNVPAAVLLSGFTQNISALIIGTNLGGLGTIIASMASLISFKYYQATRGSKSGAYFALFTLLNIIFLAALVGLYCLLNFLP